MHVCVYAWCVCGVCVHHGVHREVRGWLEESMSSLPGLQAQSVTCWVTSLIPTKWVPWLAVSPHWSLQQHFCFQGKLCSRDMGHSLLPASAHLPSLIRVLSRPVFVPTVLDVSSVDFLTVSKVALATSGSSRIFSFKTMTFIKIFEIFSLFSRNLVFLEHRKNKNEHKA